MKIYVLKVDKKFRPTSQPFLYPVHNKDYGVEQDFYNYLIKRNEIVVDTPDKANWHYLPIYWTRWHLNHEYGKAGLAELQREVDRIVIDGKRTFTVCQYDDGPIVKLSKARIFLSSRKNKQGEDIPLLSSSHKLPLIKPRKKYLASFVGRIATHSIRSEMQRNLAKTEGVYIVDGDLGESAYVKVLLQSYVALCPRGYGGSSFRFYEAMQLGIVPFLIGDVDTRPFKKEIDWDRFSFYGSSPKNVMNSIKKRSTQQLIDMGKEARKVWGRIGYGKWCKYLLEELE